ncbi:unnamed protein product, partial [Iphiclides podalirius]
MIVPTGPPGACRAQHTAHRTTTPDTRRPSTATRRPRRASDVQCAQRDVAPAAGARARTTRNRAARPPCSARVPRQVRSQSTANPAFRAGLAVR